MILITLLWRDIGIAMIGKAMLHANGSAPKDVVVTKSQTQTTQPKVITLPKPQLEERNKTATSQRNDSIISEAIFGPNVTVVPIAPRQQFEESYAAIPQLAVEMFNEYQKDVTQKEQTDDKRRTILLCYGNALA